MQTGDPDNLSPILMDRGLRAVNDLNVPPNPKVMVFRGKCLLLLGNAEEGCAIMHEATRVYPDFACGWNNAAICDLRDPEKRDLQGANFRRAADLASRPEHKNAAAANVANFDAWQRNGYHGTFDGTLVY